MDLDICVDGKGNPYLGHSREYHEKSGEPYFITMPLWEAVDWIANSDIAVYVDCKHYNAWPVIEEVIDRIGAEKCLVSSYVTELKYDFSRKPDEPDFLTEWSSIDKLRSLKSRFPSLTITPCSKWLPEDLFASDRYSELVTAVRNLLVDSNADSMCLSVPDSTISDKWLRYFLAKDIIPHVVVDKVDISKLSEPYIGETDYLEKATKVDVLKKM
jgi:hypothetical protein